MLWAQCDYYSTFQSDMRSKETTRDTSSPLLRFVFIGKLKAPEALHISTPMRSEQRERSLGKAKRKPRRIGKSFGIRNPKLQRRRLRLARAANEYGNEEA